MATFKTYDPLTGEETGEVPGRIVTCTTPGCENEGVGIEVPDDGNAVVCGPCDTIITPEQG